MKPGAHPLPPLRATRLLDQVRERMRYGHYSLSTERSYVYWVRWFIRFHGLRHPRDMGAPEVEAFLSWLANRRGVSASSHRQALAALIFLYRYSKSICRGGRRSADHARRSACRW